MKKIFTLIAILLTVHLNAQNSELERADGFFSKTYYSKALPLYLKSLPDNNTPHTIKRIGDCYYFTGMMEEAATYYGMLLSKNEENVPDDYLFKYSQALLALGKTEASDVWMKKYIERNSTLESYQQELKLLERVKGLGNRFKMENLAINTPNSDFGAYPYGSTIVYATADRSPSLFSKKYKWNNQEYLDLYSIDTTAFFDENPKSKNFSGSINTKLHESNAIFTKDGKTMYFTRNSEKRDKDDISHLMIYKAELIEDEWTNVQPLPFNGKDYSVEHPALSPDEKYLFFASDMPGSFGSFDIYGVEILEDGSYGKPVNVGPNVNTPKREQFPYISSSNLLYFSSDGHAGMGLLDVFVSVIENGVYQKPLNVGLPINSRFDDFSFYLDEGTKDGYVSSNRPDGKGDDDIYKIKEFKEFSLIVPSQYITGTVTDMTTGEPIANASLSVKDLDDNLLESTSTDPEGIYKFNLKSNNSYLLSVTKPTYVKSEKTISLDGEREKTITADFQLQSFDKVDTDMVKIDDKLMIKIEKIYFDFDKWNIREDAKPILDFVVEKMNQYPKMKIEIGSHTDQRGTDAYNEELSDKRAKSTMKYLISKGIEASRLSAKGYGENDLIVDCENGSIDCNEKQHQLNRRSEFVIKNIE
ncbi:OmpA family protein [Galbibacter sp. BG1]|uniref:OmpA family protein n=1 Tax=Galbibacter sp. BG1 TaxID=1170699 RepID=UPI0015B9B39B|nr:OmpA family protein [Galbibacter sp. BG1]QLE00574.1 OmpA family protein [Galbibacter sp. BG1]